MQCVDLWKIECAGLEPSLGWTGVPGFHPLLDHFVSQFSLYRKKVIFPSCWVYQPVVRIEQDINMSFYNCRSVFWFSWQLYPSIALDFFFRNFLALPATTLSAAPFCLQAKVYIWPAIHGPFYFEPDLGRVLSVCLDLSLLQCGLLLHPESSAWCLLYIYYTFAWGPTPPADLPSSCFSAVCSCTSPLGWPC